jgi:hypothetical protein
MRPVSLDIVAHVPATPACCCACSTVFKNSGFEDEVNREILLEYPESLREEYARLSTWIGEIATLYRETVRIRIIDATSAAGLYKAVRHWLRTYPAFIVDKRHVLSGWDPNRLRDILDECLRRIPH